MPESTSPDQHHIIGGGIAGLAAAVFLIRDAGVDGGNIHGIAKLFTGPALAILKA